MKIRKIEKRDVKGSQLGTRRAASARRGQGHPVRDRVGSSGCSSWFQGTHHRAQLRGARSTSAGIFPKRLDICLLCFSKPKSVIMYLC